MHDEDASDEPTADAAVAGVEQFQRAALDAVRAARAMLDAAESVIEDPAALDSVVRTVTAMARTAGETVVGFASGAAPSSTVPDEREDGPPDDDGRDGGFQRIPVD